jgi:hypothetical protein
MLRKKFSLLVSEVEQLKMEQAQAMEKIFSLSFSSMNVLFRS